MCINKERLIAMSISINPIHWSNGTKKNVSTVGIIAGAAAGAKAIHTATFNKSYAWNTSINKGLKQFANSAKEFPGAKYVKDIAGIIAKTSGRQKLLAAVGVAAFGTILAVRDHFSKKQGRED